MIIITSHPTPLQQEMVEMLAFLFVFMITSSSTAIFYNKTLWIRRGKKQKQKKQPSLWILLKAKQTKVRSVQTSPGGTRASSLQHESPDYDKASLWCLNSLKEVNRRVQGSYQRAWSFKNTNAASEEEKGNWSGGNLSVQLGKRAEHWSAA